MQVEDYILQGLIIGVCCLFLFAIQFLPSPGENEEPTIKGTPTEYEADPPMVEAQEAWIADDTPEDDELADLFEEYVICTNAEAGNQPDEGVRLVAAVILNRANRKLENVHKVISAPYQFSSYSDGGMQKWNNPPERIWRICREEFEHPTNLDVRFFRTGHFSEYGTPWKKVGDHYFSRR